MKKNKRMINIKFCIVITSEVGRKGKARRKEPPRGSWVLVTSYGAVWVSGHESANVIIVH